MKDKHETKENRKITLYLILAVAVILLLATIFVGLVFYVLMLYDVIKMEFIVNSRFWIIVIYAVSSMVIGAALSSVFINHVIKPISELTDGLSDLSKGNYDTNIDLGKFSKYRDVSESFNSLANELRHTEILRSDFINNFSHEFKTPIVSISGLVSLLKKEGLPSEKKDSYIAVIEDELDRLSSLSTNVLNLSKIENQNILTNVETFNLSEQIRQSILLLEKKWTKKNIGFSLEFYEHFLSGNQDLLKEVWLNLIDNAVKYGNPGSTVEIDISESATGTTVNVTDEGVSVSPEDEKSVFNKFYRADLNGADGNGIGLSIVAHVVKLHEGNVSCHSENGKTTFSVFIPKK